MSLACVRSSYGRLDETPCRTDSPADECVWSCSFSSQPNDRVRQRLAELPPDVQGVGVSRLRPIVGGLRVTAVAVSKVVARVPACGRPFLARVETHDHLGETSGSRHHLAVLYEADSRYCAESYRNEVIEPPALAESKQSVGQQVGVRHELRRDAVGVFQVLS